ncbi:MAG: Ig-like domain-containing protein [Planctomycetota bacterium]
MRITIPLLLITGLVLAACGGGGGGGGGEGNQPPRLDPASITIAEDESGGIDLAGYAHDPDGDILSYRIEQEPGHCTASIAGSLLTITPPADWHGEDTCSVVAGDGAQESAPVRITMTISPRPDAPRIEQADPVAVSMPQDGAWPGIALSAVDADGDALGWSIAGQAAHGRAGFRDAADPTSLGYTPEPGWSGSDAFQVAVSDGSLVSEPLTVAVTVTAAANTAPRLDQSGPIQTTIAEDGSWTAPTLGASDAEGDAISWRVSQAAGHGTAVFVDPADPGSLDYAPAGGHVGTDSFQIQAGDGELWSEALTIQVSIPDRGGPAISPLSLSGRRGLAVEAVLPAVDRNGHPITYAVEHDLGENLHVAQTTEGLRFIVPHGWTQPITASYTASSRLGTSPAATIDITFEPDAQAHPYLVSGALRMQLNHSGDDNSFHTTISEDGQVVCFGSFATNLIEDVDLPALVGQIYCRDLESDGLELISRNPAGMPGNGDCYAPDLSADGSLVVFVSMASDLVPGHGGGYSDIFVHDRHSGVTTCISRALDGSVGNADSWDASISHDGRWVAFASLASNLVPGDDNAVADIFLHDRSNGTTTLISKAAGQVDADGWSDSSKISGDGKHIVFASYATNLTDTSREDGFSSDIHLYDHDLGTIRRVVTDMTGREPSSNRQEPSISSDGRQIVFSSREILTSDDSRASDIYHLDLVDSRITRIPLPPNETRWEAASYEPMISSDGSHILFSSNLYPESDSEEGVLNVLMLHQIDGLTRTLLETGLLPGGYYMSPAVDAHAERVVFWTYAAQNAASDPDGLGDAFLIDTTSGDVELLSRTVQPEPHPDQDGDTYGAHASPDGRWVVYCSEAADQTTEASTSLRHIVLLDRSNGTKWLVSRAHDGAAVDGPSDTPRVSDDGGVVVFCSAASNLVPDDTNGVSDVFAWERASGTIERISLRPDGSAAFYDSVDPDLDASGRWVVFTSRESLTDDLSVGWTQVYLHDRSSGLTSLVSRSLAGGTSDGSCRTPRISSDGAWIVYCSDSGDLVSDGPDSSIDQVYLHDRLRGSNRLISRRPDGSPAVEECWTPDLAGDGSLLVYVSKDGGLVGEMNTHFGTRHVFTYERDNDETTLISRLPSGGQSQGWNRTPTISESGRWIVFSSEDEKMDTDSAWDGDYTGLVLYDRDSRTNRSMPGDGASANYEQIPQVLDATAGAPLFLFNSADPGLRDDLALDPWSFSRTWIMTILDGDG